MTWWVQIILAIVSAAGFVLLLSANRRQDAQTSIFMLSLLLSVCGLVVPDILSFLPACWWCIFMLRASNIKTYLASLLGPVVVGIYFAICQFIWPDSSAISQIVAIWGNTFHRSVGILSSPLWITITSGLIGLLGFSYMFAHFSRFATANVRIQVRILLATPFYWLSLLSILFPAESGDKLLAVFWLVSIYISALYISVYGLPKFSFRAWHSSTPSNRSYSRRRSHSSRPASIPRGMRPKSGWLRRRR